MQLIPDSMFRIMRKLAQIVEARSFPLNVSCVVHTSLYIFVYILASDEESGQKPDSSG